MVSVSWQEYCSPIRDQGNCGSCCAFGSIGAWESSIRIKKQDKTLGVDLSERDLFFCSLGTCNTGNTVEKTLDRAVRGVAIEACCPYVDSNALCGQGRCPEWWVDGEKLASWKVITNIQEMKNALQNGPLVGVMAVHESFLHYLDGAYESLGAEDPIVGYHCFVGSTKIPLLDGRELTLKELEENYKDKSFWVYSCDKEGNIVAGKAHSPRLTKINEKIIEIKLDNGEIIKCTYDHPFLMRNGSYKNAKDLRHNDSLMPLYRKINKYGYEICTSPKNRKDVLTHNLSITSVRGEKSDDSLIVHHIDYNKGNNSPENLKYMSWDEHTKLHSEQSNQLTKFIRSKKGRKQSRELMNKLWTNETWREERLELNKKNLRDANLQRAKDGLLGFQCIDEKKLYPIQSENGRRNVHFMNTPEAKQKSSLTFRKHMKEDEEFAKKVRGRAVKNLQDYNKFRNGKTEPTEKQKKAWKENGQKLNQSPTTKKLAHVRSTYVRFYSKKYTFEEYLKIKNITLPLINHRVVSIKPCGTEDVYDFTVEKYHNFALSSGVFVHNCIGIVGYDDNKQAWLIRNSWNTLWGMKGYCWIKYRDSEIDEVMYALETSDEKPLPDSNPACPYAKAVSKIPFVGWNLVRGYRKIRQSLFGTKPGNP